MEYTLKLNGEEATLDVRNIYIIDRAGAVADEIKLEVRNDGVQIGRGYTLEAVYGGITSGKMFVDKLVGGNRTTQIGAISTPLEAKKPKTRNWLRVRLFDIVNDVATNLTLSVFYAGVENHYYENVTQLGETDLAFLSRLCRREGYGLKIDNGRLVLFDLDSLQRAEVVKTIKVGDELNNVVRFADNANPINSVTVKYYNGDRLISKTATGSLIGDSVEICEYVADEAEAERFARGYLKTYKHNGVVADVLLPITTEIAAGNCVAFEGFDKYDGKYYIEECVYDPDNDQCRVIARAI